METIRKLDRSSLINFEIEDELPIDREVLYKKIEAMKRMEATLASEGWEDIRNYITNRLSIDTLLSASVDRRDEIIGGLTELRNLLKFVESTIEEGKRAQERLTKLAEINKSK